MRSNKLACQHPTDLRGLLVGCLNLGALHLNLGSLGVSVEFVHQHVVVGQHTLQDVKNVGCFVFLTWQDVEFF